MSILRPWPLNADSALWKSGPEIINIAASIATHRGFASPFGIPTGPTAWIPPVYPYLIATLFRAFGLRSNLAALSILAMQALFSALTCIPIYAIAKRAFDEKTGAWAAWGWALFPYAIVIPVLFVWETALSGLLLATLCYLCLDLPQARPSTQIALGITWGIAALTNTALLSVMPFFLLSPYLSRPVHLPWKTIATIVVTSALVVCPWILRNWYQLGTVIPVRSNFGEELWVGNHQGGTGRTEYGLTPSENEGERERYRALGEISYVAQRKTEAMNFISENPGQFLRQTFYRLRYWWFAEGESARLFILYRLLAVAALVGMALALRTIAMRTIANGSILAILSTVVVYPLVYYLTDVYARYRYPIEPFMMLLAAFAVSQAYRSGKRRIGRSRPGGTSCKIRVICLMLHW